MKLLTTILFFIGYLLVVFITGLICELINKAINKKLDARQQAEDERMKRQLHKIKLNEEYAEMVALASIYGKDDE